MFKRLLQLVLLMAIPVYAQVTFTYPALSTPNVWTNLNTFTAPVIFNSSGLASCSILTTVAGVLTCGGYAPAHGGANFDIASLSGLTTALSTGQGGTGAITASGALVNLGGVGSFTYAGTSAPSATCSALVNNGYIATNATPQAYQCSNATGSYAWNVLGSGGGGGNGFPITLGSTSVAASSTTPSIAGLTLTSPTITGIGSFTGTTVTTVAAGGAVAGYTVEATGLLKDSALTTAGVVTNNASGALGTVGTTGSGSVVLLNSPVYSNVGNANLIFGSSFSSNTTGYGNTANGVQALYSNTTGNNNTANGNAALQTNTTGYDNTANGLQALYSNTTGNSNTANGMYALYANTTGYNNTANGYAALQTNTTGSSNTANGYKALYANTTGYDNTANGYAALHSNTTGAANTANGLQALYSNTTGNSNTANGMYALYSNTTGNNNTANGYHAGQYIADGVTANQTSSNSVYEGFQAYPLASGDTNENVIGNAAIGHGSNTTTLGNASITDTYLQGTTHSTSANFSGTVAAGASNISGNQAVGGNEAVSGALSANASIAATAAPSTVPQIIVDDDVDADADAFMSLSAINHWIDAGQVKVLAMVADSSNPYAASVMSIINSYWGHASIPVGAYQGKRDRQHMDGGCGF